MSFIQEWKTFSPFLNVSGFFLFLLLSLSPPLPSFPHPATPHQHALEQNVLLPVIKQETTFGLGLTYLNPSVWKACGYLRLLWPPLESKLNLGWEVELIFYSSFIRKHGSCYSVIPCLDPWVYLLVVGTLGGNR